MTAVVDAALTAFLGKPFPGYASPDGAEHYRSLMAQALAAAAAKEEELRQVCPPPFTASAPPQNPSRVP